MQKKTTAGIERVQRTDSHRVQAEERLLSGLTETKKASFILCSKRSATRYSKKIPGGPGILLRHINSLLTI